MDRFNLPVALIFSLFILSGCDLLPEDTELTSSRGLVNKGIMSNAEVNAFRLDNLEFLKRTYTKSDGTFSYEDIDYAGAIYIEVTTTSQTLATCDSASGCGNFKNNLKLPGEFDGNLDGIVNFGDIHYYNNTDFLLTAFVRPKTVTNDGGDNTVTFGVFTVTPLTHIAAQKIKKKRDTQGSISEEDIDLANAQVAELFGLDGIDITRVIPPDVTNKEQMEAVSEKQKMYSTLNAAVASAITVSRSLVQVIEVLTNSFVNDGGIVGNSSDPDEITLSYLLSKAGAIAEKVGTELSINMNSVKQKLVEQKAKNDSLASGDLVQPSEQAGIIVDRDGDGLADIDEQHYGTNPDNPDTDGDQLPDGWEVKYDVQQLPDDWDHNYKFDPLLNNDSQNYDGDNDGLTALQEFLISTDPTNSDTNGSGISDGDEDFDNDMLTNSQELNGGESEYGSFVWGDEHPDPYNPDSDNGGVLDGYEVHYDNTNPLDSSDDYNMSEQ